jgi:hypothetical protein
MGARAAPDHSKGTASPESYLGTIAELIRTGQDEAAVATVEQYGAAMLSRLSPEQVIRLGSMMEGAVAAVEAATMVERRQLEPPVAAD